MLLEQGDDEHGVLAVDPGKLALAAAEDSALDAQLIERFTGCDQALLDLARCLASESASGYPNGPLFWNEMASAFVDFSSRFSRPVLAGRALASQPSARSFATMTAQ